MTEEKDIFRQYDGRLEPGADFEQQVFFKIKKKKKLKKIGYSFSIAGSILLMFSLLQVFRPTVQPVLQSRSETPLQNKEEIPLHEDLFFSTSDSHTRYSLEPVSYQHKSKKQNPTLNQI